MGENAQMKYVTSIDDLKFEIEINDESHVIIDGVSHEIDFHAVGKLPMYSLLIGGHSYEAYVEIGDEGWQVLHRGHVYNAHVDDERAQMLSHVVANQAIGSGGTYLLRAPMAGIVVTLLVEEGQAIAKGEVLVVLEAMKMQNELKSRCNGVVTRICVQPGDNIPLNHDLVVISVVES